MIFAGLMDNRIIIQLINGALESYVMNFWLANHHLNRTQMI